MFHQEQSIRVFVVVLHVFLFAQSRMNSAECREIPSAGALQFFALGDWGGAMFSPYYTAVEKAVAEEMGKMADLLKPEFILALGMVMMIKFHDCRVCSIDG
jgi:hypothetical protein